MVSATASLYSMIALSDCARDEMRGGSGAASSQCVVERSGPWKGDTSLRRVRAFTVNTKFHIRNREVLPCRTPRIS